MISSEKNNRCEGWEEIEHSADIALRVRAKTMESLFRYAAEGMTELLLDPSGVEPRLSKQIHAQGPDPESLLVGWLEEILLLFEVESISPKRCTELRFENEHLTGTIEGERFDPDRHEIRNKIKAVTWHGIEIKKTDDFFEVTIIFDV